MDRRLQSGRSGPLFASPLFENTALPPAANAVGLDLGRRMSLGSTTFGFNAFHRASS
jgi:hypothetical protein